ncbi:MAG: SRPBCC family protein [Acidobacteria bacterium]|nr:SRPBCC family protein [Acidobacteriota bacterium]
MRDFYRLDTWLWLPLPRQDVFAFFADAFNLERITPAFLRFRVLTPRPIPMRAGTTIDYRISLHGLPMTWKTEISLWEPPGRFRDVQLRGPYRDWIHTHTFEEQDGGTLVRDTVRYRMWLPQPLAGAVNALLVARDVRTIFLYRHDALLEAFGVRGQARLGPVTLSGPEPGPSGDDATYDAQRPADPAV